MSSRRSLLVLLWLLVFVTLAVNSEESIPDESIPDESVPDEGIPEESVAENMEKPPENPPEAVAETPIQAQPSEDAFDAKDPNRDWGTYYDPKNIFCGEFDCYKILGFDFEAFGKNHPDRKTITQRYRQLSREWHPDKSRHKDAKEKFVKIARAYEVLTDEEQREEYDFMRYNQEAYFQKYGTSVLWSYAPKSDASIIIIVLLLIGNAFTWFAQKNRWQNVADRLSKAALEDWSASQGGSPESKQLREHALELLAEREAEGEDAAATKNGGKTGKQAKKKVSGKEKKKRQEEALKPIIAELVNEMHDFGGGFHQPTWRDLLIVKLGKMPYNVGTAIVWNTKYFIRRLQKQELNDEEREVLTRRAVGHVAWDLASDEDIAEMVKRELWITENLVEWKEEQEVKNLSTWEQKAYNRWKRQEKKKV